MFLHHRPVKTVITGKSGSGKTTYFQRVIENGFGSYWKTVFLYDWQGEMAERLNVQPCFSLEQLPEALKSGFVAYDPCEDFDDDMENGLLAFAHWCFEVCKADDKFPEYPRLFCCDEVQLLIDTPNYCPREIKRIYQTGRRCGLDSAFVAQQLNELNNKIRSQSTERVTFQHEDPLVLELMAKWGFKPQDVASLAVGEFLYRNDKGESGRQAMFNGSRSQSHTEAKTDDRNDSQETVDNQGGQA